jgi:hypothetical protein
LASRPEQTHRSSIVSIIALASFLRGEAHSNKACRPCWLSADVEEDAMPTQKSVPPIDLFIHEIRTALTVVKIHAQSLARTQWSVNAEERSHLTSRLKCIDDAANRAAKHVADLVEANARDAASRRAE